MGDKGMLSRNSNSSRNEKSAVTLVPIRSSLSKILGDVQVWSNTVCTSVDALQRDSKYGGQLDVFVQKLAEKHALKGPPLVKKSRQVFTCSRPPVDLAKDAEVYESIGGEETAMMSGMEPLVSEELAAKRAKVELDTVPQRLEPVKCTDCAGSAPVELVLPLGIHSEFELKPCFAQPKKSNLLYSVSDSSLPKLHRSSFIFSRLPSQMPPFNVPGNVPDTVFDVTPKHSLLKPTLQRTDVTLQQSLFINPLSKDILIECKMDDALAKKIANTIQRVRDKAQRGRFMSYAKFNSSFKLSEVFYEDMNSRSISRAPSLGRSIQLTQWVHKINPNFNDSQSISEAMTMRSLSSITAFSRITKMCLARMCAKVKSGRDPLNSDCLQSGFSSSKHIEPIRVSSISANSGFPLACRLATARRRQLSHLQTSCHTGWKETDVWSSSASSGYLRAVPRRLVDIVSPSCIFFRTLWAEKRPMWQLKWDKVMDNEGVDFSNFTSKAHNYMQVRDRHEVRCFFQLQPSYRVVDECVQFPDVALPTDRSSESKEASSRSRIVEKNPIPLMESDEPKPEERPSEVNIVCSKNQTTLNVIVACKPIASTSANQASSTDVIQSPQPLPKIDSIVNIPPSSFSNCQLSDFPAVSQAPLLRTQAPTRAPTKRSKLRATRACQPDRFCRSYRAFCDKRRIKIRYENGRYTVLKEFNESKRQTIWSILRGKATRLLNSVVHKRSRPQRPR